MDCFPLCVLATHISDEIADLHSLVGFAVAPRIRAGSFSAASPASAF